MADASQSSHLILFCLVEGEEEDNIMEIHATRSCTMNQLKNLIRDAREANDQVPIKIAACWKLDPPISTEGVAYLDRIRAIAESGPDPELPSPIVVMKPTLRVGAYFASQPEDGHIHILVRKDPNLTKLHELFWGVSDSPYIKDITSLPVPDLGDPDSIDEEPFTIIRLPDGVVFPYASASSVLLVTQVYKEFWELLQGEDEHWEAQEGPRFLQNSHATIISGQPGIGKTFFLSYVLVRRLQKERETVYCGDGAFVHVFTHSGVRKVPLSSLARIKELDEHRHCCALVNIGGNLKQPPSQFYPERREGRLVVATSPNPEHSASFSKENVAKILWMPTWDWEELYCSSLLQTRKQLQIVDREHYDLLKSAYLKFSGIPRRCLYAFTRDGIKGHVVGIQEAIDDVTDFLNFFSSLDGQMPFNNKASHMLVRVEPVEGFGYTRKRITVLSIFVGERILERMRRREGFAISRSIRSLLHSPSSRSFSGRLFEAPVHRRLLCGTSFTPVPLPHQTTPPPLKIVIPRNSESANPEYHTFSIRSKPRSQSVAPEFQNRYLIPVSQVAASVDSVWIGPDVTVFFQITVSPDHPIKLSGLLQLTKKDKLPNNARKKICIIFVVPAGDAKTENFKRQTIDSPLGSDTKDVETANGYPQYVYYFPLDDFDQLNYLDHLDDDL
ncbi:hypothetical protein BOTBODRAFT_41603 [Botryobasidium botryosum FD-172 SS1]|uniref:Crinkler effector protein N-terminal domain-containing protein n=1 Tax=Botryobasidium botryosum (strain FD-172 SS1) TaxID=930990 RepID=A0A067MUG1_BOTB1|nr:hypothetical protein BOTBODRAFT_41603 [Botryobasidium botryosum FD-172 SS1]